MKLGDVIARRRAEKGLSQKDLAAILKRDPTMISRWESGRVEPDVQSLRRLATALDTTVFAILAEAGLVERAESEARELPLSFEILSPTIPVFGFGSAGEGITVGDSGYPVGQSDFWVPRSMDNRDPHAYATRVVGRSMAPYFEEGDIVEVRTDVAVQNGQLAVVIAPDGRKWIKKVHFVPRRRVIRCEPLNRDEESFELPIEGLRLHRIVGMKRKGMY